MNRIAYRLAPAGLLPALFSSVATFFEVRKLPEVVDLVQSSDLSEPCCIEVSKRF